MSSNILRGRFGSGISDLLLGFSSSLDVDREMFLEDVWGSEAHVLMLARQKIISGEDASKILMSLENIKKDYLAGTFELSEELEDVHMNIERRVIDDCGIEYGGRMHTARSRNDQVQTDTRMRLRERILDLADAVLDLQDTLLKLSEKHAKDIMPGYTHMQRAQPVTFGFWASSYASMLSRDLDRLDGAYGHVNMCPLGAGALAGTSFPTDRKYVADLLGFDGVQEHALDVVGSRDFIIETVSALAILMSNLSKLAEEMVLWSTQEFGFIEFSDEFATGSSIMPQKKNPDMAELVRGKTGRVYGALVQILTVTKALPSGYNRDLQEDRKPLWSALEIAASSVRVMDAGLSGVKINTGAMKEAVYSDYSTATELANYLVRVRGLPFREAYTVTGSLVKWLSGINKRFTETKLIKSELAKKGIELSEKEIKEILDPVKVVSRQKSLGSTGPAEVKRMATELSKDRGRRKKDLEKKREKINSAMKRTEKEIKKLP